MLKLRISRITQLHPQVKLFQFSPRIRFHPGQFLLIWIPGVDQIPLSLCDSDKLLVKRVGDATSKMFQLEPGAELGALGPLGRGFELTGSRIALVGGGIGLAPLLPLAKLAHARGLELKICLGANTCWELFLIDEFRKYGELSLATLDGSLGKKSNAIQLLDPVERFDQIYGCGPEPMLYSLALRFQHQLDQLQLCLERYIKCGLGICGSCCLGRYLVCRDGPVFRADQLLDTEFGKSTRNGACRLHPLS